MKSLVRNLALLSCISGFVLGGCSSSQGTAQNGYQQGQWRPGGGAPGQWGQPPGGQSGPPQYVPPPANLPPVANDPINNLDLGWMRQRAASILAETEASLPPNRRARVDGIPLVNDDSPGEINAYAGCDQGGAPFMATTDGLLEVLAFAARFRATDEVFNTRKLDGYEQMVAQNMQPNQPLPRPQQQFIDPMQDMDGRKVARQNVLFDASLAFVLGHELGHHYLGHTGCAKGVGGGVSLNDIFRLGSHAVPLFNQPNETAADTTGTYSAMTIGSRRQSGQFQEEGALLVLNFFLVLEDSAGAAKVLGYVSSHPPATLRIPWVQWAASNWRRSGGNPVPVPGYPGF